MGSERHYRSETEGFFFPRNCCTFPSREVKKLSSIKTKNQVFSTLIQQHTGDLTPFSRAL